MKRFVFLCYLIFQTCFSLVQAAGAADSMSGMEDAMQIQREQLERMREFLGPDPADTDFFAAKRQQPVESTITFRNPAAEAFFVDSEKLPDGTYSSFSHSRFTNNETEISELRCWPLLGWLIAHLWRSKRNEETFLLVCVCIDTTIPGIN